MSDITTQSGPIRAMSCFIQKDEHISVFHGFASRTLFQRYRPVFHATMNRFKVLTNPQRLNVRPDRLRVRATKTTGILKEALRSLGIPDGKLKEIAVLNGQKSTDTVPADTLLKVVERGN
jgi:hypothetical protein